MNNWNDYLKKTKNMKARPLLVEALPYVKNKNHALDLGCGAGDDSRFLKEEGFLVTSVDNNPEVKKYVDSPNLVISTYANFDFPTEYYDLVNAQHSLPFNPPESFNPMFERLTKSLKPGGIFAGQFFGKEDSWSSDKSMTFHTEAEIRSLLSSYKVHVFREEKKEGKTVSGDTKFWHVFHVIAERI
ncbi:MAG: class I SAM-dependent methyltransferase [Minisyncoccota bacterium]